MLIQQRCASGKFSIAAAGSCGKTSTTALIAETFCNLNKNAECVNGGMIHAFKQGNYPGNYHPGDDALVFEADESDKSLLEFHPDYALVLNIGTDHYPKAELEAMFAQFVNQAKKGAVLLDEVYTALRDKIRPDLPVATFGTSDLADIKVANYRSAQGRSFADFNTLNCELPAPGFHTALNVAATAALLDMLQTHIEPALQAALNTRGVARRFDFKGRTNAGAAVYDDYAHNPEKVANILRTAQELTASNGRVLALFQPHGYGPFGFMQEELGRNLHDILRPYDKLYIAEPFYAGGTSSFSPHASEVLTRWHSLTATRWATGLVLLLNGHMQTVLLVVTTLI
jgi:UDP-N-acetylmuramate--alanine ligase